MTIFNVTSQERREDSPKQFYELIPGHRDNYLNSKMDTKTPTIYCYKGKKKELKYLWETVSISVKLNNDLFELFQGESPEAVLENFRLHQSSWSTNLFPFRKRKLIYLNPFNKTCIGILTSKNYSVALIINDVDHAQLFKFIIGLLLFFYAQKLCHNQVFYYLCGIAFGISGSILILVYLIGRIFPNKPMMYAFAAGGWTMSIYFIQYLWDNTKLIALQYMQYVLGYIAVSGLISFAVCYRFGPLTNPRSKNLIQWLLQSTGLMLIFYSSHLREVTYTVDLVLLLSRIIPFSLIFSGFCLVKRKLIRPKIKLLTKKEYIEQGKKETQKALEELRGYCSSPECKPWKTVLKLRNPTRFAEFIEGSPHLSDEEIEEYGSLSFKPNGTIITDDSDSVAEYSEED